MLRVWVMSEAMAGFETSAELNCLQLLISSQAPSTRSRASAHLARVRLYEYDV